MKESYQQTSKLCFPRFKQVLIFFALYFEQKELKLIPLYKRLEIFFFFHSTNQVFSLKSKEITATASDR
ncbi:Uncharacterized protein TCM_045199 [Theobroma cacao]|uniref:Uncharacterized protein n=1 Tax=Theobroma cacao TaxID=3641 RepID=A0A061FYF8_THECC|nr:Uncharacterized protein TCM_045199 [Theobroma cacao]